MSGSSVHVLHVDDDPSVVDLVEATVGAESGIRVTGVEDPGTALDRFDPGTFDCVVSDYEMPRIDGLELYERLEPEFDHADFPFILFTGRGSESVAAEALNAGITAYLQKGGREQYERLANRIRNATAQHRAELKAERYETVIEALGYPVYVVDEDGTFRFVNEPFADIVGYDREEIIGKPPSFLKPEADVRRAEDELRSLLSSDGPDVSRFHVTLETASGEEVPCRDHMGVLPYEGDQFRGSVGILRPLEEGGQSPGSGVATADGGYADPDRCQTVLETLNDPVYVLDERGNFEYVNQAFLDLVGYERERVLGSGPTLIKSQEAKETAERELGRILSSEGPDDVSFEIMIQPREGEPIACEDHMGVLPYEGDQFRGSVGVLRDVSERRARERRLERQNERLEAFASVVSHDLRNPLNVAQARLELLAEEVESEHVDAIGQAHERMETLIEDLLALARQGESVTEVEPVDLADVARRAWKNVEATEARLVVDVEGRIEADASRLRQLFGNLFRNAVEHAGPDVTVRVGEHEDGFFVADDGPGLPDEDVFEPEFTTAEDGMGLGLAIVEEIARSHDWRTTAAESESGGARFEIRGVESVD